MPLQDDAIADNEDDNNNVANDDDDDDDDEVGISVAMAFVCCSVFLRARAYAVQIHMAKHGLRVEYYNHISIRMVQYVCVKSARYL